MEPQLKSIPAIIAFLGSDPGPRAYTLAEQLVRFREGRGWSQKQLAPELRADSTTLSRWELGKKAVWGAYRDRVSALLDSGFNEAH